MFGQGRFQNGLLVQPMPEFAFNPVNETPLERFRNLVWYVHELVYSTLVIQYMTQGEHRACK